MKKLPIGIQDFENIIVKDYIYVDKTNFIHNLLESGGETFFISRPRRFGKSLLLSTIKAVMEGRRELFEGLYIYDKISWQPHPVILLDMGARASGTVEEFKISLTKELRSLAEGFGVMLTGGDIPANDLLTELVRALRDKTGKQVVVLVDEYDKPILDAMGHPESAVKIRDMLRSFYTVIKSISGNLRLVVLTGVSKISHVSVFSGLNNLYDLTMDREFAGICGYTQQDLENHFSDYIYKLAKEDGATRGQTIQKIGEWYNGYSWDGKTFVYNPFSTLLLFRSKEFSSHWFATGTTYFLLKLMRDRDDFSPVLDDEIVRSPGFTDRQSVEHLELASLLFQTGYLTVKHRDDTGNYHLGLPNMEVKQAFTESLLGYLTGKGDSLVAVLAGQIRSYFSTGNVEGAIENIRTLFAGIAYGKREENEYHYHAMFQLTMKLVGIHHHAEAHTDKGLADSVLQFADRIYVIEFKYSKYEKDLPRLLDTALNQIQDKGYHEQYRVPGRKLHLLALAFTKGKIVFRVDNSHD